jgi:hypothetical protein
MKKIVFISFLMIGSHLYAAPNPLFLAGSVGSYYFKLINDKQHCQLSIQTMDKSIQSFQLSSQSPCYFFTDNKQEKIQTYAYPDAKVDYVLLIGGTEVTLSAKERQLKKLPPKSYCTQDSQAIILEKGKIKVGFVDNKTFACAEDRLDEKVYQQMLTQKRLDIKTIIAQQKKAILNTQSNAAEISFVESLQQKIEAIFGILPISNK